MDRKNLGKTPHEVEMFNILRVATHSIMYVQFCCI
jgi:hypothetical protein